MLQPLLLLLQLLLVLSRLARHLVAQRLQPRRGLLLSRDQLRRGRNSLLPLLFLAVFGFQAKLVLHRCFNQTSTQQAKSSTMFAAFNHRSSDQIVQLTKLLRRLCCLLGRLLVFFLQLLEALLHRADGLAKTCDLRYSKWEEVDG